MMQGGLRSIDRAQLRALLRAYLRMSAQGVALLRNREGMPSSLAYVLVMYAIIGALMSVMAFMRIDVLSFTMFLHWMTFFAVGAAAVVESNDVLFDPNEEEILLPHPVHPSTLLAAKGIALVGFTSMLAGALNLVPTVVGWMAQGAHPWFSLVHIASTALLVVFTCAAVVCTYGLVLRMFGRERFENFAVYAQVAMIFVLTGGYQILPRFMFTPQDGDPSGHAGVMRYLLVAPPAWFASIDATLGADVTALEPRICAVLALLATLVLAWLAVGKLSTSYSDVAPRRGDARAAEEHDAPRRELRAKPRGRTWNPIASLWLRDPVEHGAFRLASAYLRRDREVKLRLFPQLGVFVMFIAMQAMERHGHSIFMPIAMLGFAGTMPLVAIDSLRMSSHHAAADLFRYAPLRDAASLFHGVRKASIVFAQAPLIALSLVMLALGANGDRDPLELALPLLLVMPTVSLLPGAFGAFLPLSQPPRRGEQSSRNVGVSFAMTLFMFAPLGLAYLARELGVWWIMIGVEIVAVVIAHRWLMRLIEKRPMRSIE
jgi:hypothetical protein